MMRRSIGVATDLYELTMAAAYFEQGMTQRAVFELFIRSLPQNRSFLITAGLEQALEYLESLRFNADEIGYLKSHPAFENISGAEIARPSLFGRLGRLPRDRRR